MINIMMNICERSEMLRIMLLTKTVINVICIVVPLLLMVSLMYALVKYLVTNDSNYIAKIFDKATKRILATIIVFLVPVFVNMMLEVLGASNIYGSCLSNVSEETIRLAKAKEDSQKEIENAQRQLQNEANAKKYQEQLEEERRRAQQNQNSSNTGNTGNTSSSNTGNTGNTGNTSSGATVNSAGNIHYFRQCYESYSGTKWANCGNICGCGCGLASLAMITSKFGNKTYDPGELVRGGLFNSYIKNTGFDSSGYNNSTLASLGLKVEKLNISNSSKTYNSTVANQLYNVLATGKAVIINTPSHYVVVSKDSCPDGQVYLYDPYCGTSKGKSTHSSNGCKTMEDLWENTYNRYDRCTDSGNCGWKGIWAFESK